MKQDVKKLMEQVYNEFIRSFSDEDLNDGKTRATILDFGNKRFKIIYSENSICMKVEEEKLPEVYEDYLHLEYLFKERKPIGYGNYKCVVDHMKSLVVMKQLSF